MEEDGVSGGQLICISFVATCKGQNQYPELLIFGLFPYAEAGSKRKRKSLNDLTDKKGSDKKGADKKGSDKKEPFLVNRVVQLKPSLSGLSVEVDDEDPEEETVDQPVSSEFQLVIGLLSGELRFRTKEDS
jgi:hypothetical protein